MNVGKDWLFRAEKHLRWDYMAGNLPEEDYFRSLRLINWILNNWGGLPAGHID